MPSPHESSVLRVTAFSLGTVLACGSPETQELPPLPEVLETEDSDGRLRYQILGLFQMDESERPLSFTIVDNPLAPRVAVPLAGGESFLLFQIHRLTDGGELEWDAAPETRPPSSFCRCVTEDNCAVQAVAYSARVGAPEWELDGRNFRAIRQDICAHIPPGPCDDAARLTQETCLNAHM